MNRTKVAGSKCLGRGGWGHVSWPLASRYSLREESWDTDPYHSPPLHIPQQLWMQPSYHTLASLPTVLKLSPAGSSPHFPMTYAISPPDEHPCYTTYISTFPTPLTPWPVYFFLITSWCNSFIFFSIPENPINKWRFSVNWFVAYQK